MELQKTLYACREAKHRFRSPGRHARGCKRPACPCRSAAPWRSSPMRSFALSRRLFLSSVAVAALTAPAFAAGSGGDPIRKLVILSAAQASVSLEFKAAKLLAQAWRQIGLDIEVRGMPLPQLADLVWYSR